jgi:hypothetical protein
MNFFTAMSPHCIKDVTSIKYYVQGILHLQVSVIMGLPDAKGVGQQFGRYPAWCPWWDHWDCQIVASNTHGLQTRMNPDQEQEVLLNVACGLDPLTAVVAASDDSKPQRSGCSFAALLMVAGLAWLIARL